MIRGARKSALLLALPLALPLITGCTETLYGPSQPVRSAGAVDGGAMQGGAVRGGTGMEGSWTSNDGVFIATFDGGIFTSRFTQTNEILAQGTYTVTGKTVRLEWISVAAQQSRAATCAIASASSVTCMQDGGGSFSLNRAT